MARVRRIHNLVGYGTFSIRRHIFYTTIYTLVLLLIQILWVSRISYPSLRIDLMLPLMFGTAVTWPPTLGIAWACGCGFIADTLSGKFWGLHVGSYVSTVCLVNMTAKRFELQNPFYQMFFVGLCALAQSFALGFFLFVEMPVRDDLLSMALSLTIRSAANLVITPFVTFPIWNLKDTGL